MAYFQRRRWDTQPPPWVGPDNGSALTDGLAFLWTDGNALRDRVTGAFATARNAPAILTRNGAGVSCTTGQANLEWSRQFIATSNSAGTGDFTMLVLAAPSVGGGAVQHVFAQKNDAAGAPFAQVAILANADATAAYSSGSLSFFTYNSTSSGIAFAGGVDGLPHIFVGKRLGNAMTLSIDGNQVAVNTGTAKNILQTATRYTAIGSRGNGTAEAMSGPAVFAAAWNRALTLNEILELGRVDRLWQLLEPRRVWVPVTVAAPSVPTLSASTYVPGSLTSTGWRPQITAS